MKLRIGSRGSQLALWQANHIKALLEDKGHSVTIEIIKTTGDRLQAVTFAQVAAQSGTTKGMFTKEIEEALQEGRVDLAVHSLKDLPTQLPEGFALAATPERVDPRDVLVSVKYDDLASLPQGAVVGTSSQRRRAQLKALRPDIEAVEFRGNVDTRLRKLAEGQVDAILLAAAGLDRLEKTEWIRQRMEPKDFCPAAGQGSLGIETREGDDVTLGALKFLDHPDTRYAVTAERAALAALGGGCQVPIGIHCRRMLAGDVMEIYGVVADPATGKTIRAHQSADRAGVAPADLGKRIAERLVESGAATLLNGSTEIPAGA
ncbi:hydroxymethylbilane synthase [Acidobacteria bacterium AB60]|nr:hydroxymethylbilane synthase [Acidobacteria bacterium AB60]